MFTDIHCHIIPNIDDGSASLTSSLDMAKTASTDGTKSLIATPHQLGTNRGVTAAAIRNGAAALQEKLRGEEIGVTILPGADVRIDPELPKLLKEGKVLTLADRGKHVLLELPHDSYYPIDKLLKSLRKQGLVGILSHPERNRGIMEDPDVMWEVIEAGGLLQITAASLTGAFGSSCQEIAELAVDEGLIHFIASDAHDTKHRPFGMRDAYDTICDMAGAKLADLVCCENPARVFEGDDVKGGLVGKNSRRSIQKRAKSSPNNGKRALDSVGLVVDDASPLDFYLIGIACPVFASWSDRINKIVSALSLTRDSRYLLPIRTKGSVYLTPTKFLNTNS